MAIRLDYTQANFESQFSALLDSKRESDQDVADVVASILARIRHEGDAALLDLTAQFDRFKQDKVATLAISKAEMQAALDGLDPALRAALEMARDRIRAFHEKQIPADFGGLVAIPFRG